MGKILSYVKNNKIKVILAVLVVAVVVFFLTRPPKEIKRDLITVARTSVVQEIDVTGRIEPAQAVDLAVESGGKVSAVPISVGQKVSAGQTLLRVNTSDLAVRLAQQQAALEKARLVLEKEEPKTEASDDLEKAYEDGFNAVADSFLDLPSVVSGLDDILGNSYLSHNNIRTFYPKNAQTFRDDAIESYYIAENAYEEILKQYRASSRESESEDIDDLIVETYDAIKLIADAVKITKNFVDYIEDQDDQERHAEEISADQSSLDDFTAQTSGHLVSLLEIKDTIQDSNTGITDEGYDIESIKIDIRQAELDIRETEVAIGNRIIRAPISGTVSLIDAKVGETISANNPVISLISSNQFQIEANLPESDIAKVGIGREAEIVLDAYGSDVVFPAKVVAIDPAETLVEGVATYKTTLQFLENDERIKSGMTADITIKGERREDVLSVPQRAVVTKDGRKYVEVLESGVVVEKTVETGLRGTDGNIEITSGLNEGDQVIVFSEEKK